MMIKSTKLAGALAAALCLAAPLALSTTQANAAPIRGGGMMMDGVHNNMGHVDIFHDPRIRPPARHEARTRMPHRGHQWHEGRWNWQRGQ